MNPAPVHVVAGALIDSGGRVLIAERPAGKAQAGRWEFPGGKRTPKESPREALARELLEELGIELGEAAPLLGVTHHYASAPAPVFIDAWRVESWRGEIRALDGQRLRWCSPRELAEADILEADYAIVTALLLPRLFVRVAPDRAGDALARAGARGARLGLLLDAGAEPGLVSRLEADGAAVFIIDPPPGTTGRAVYTRIQNVRPSGARLAPAGSIVASGAEAVAARANGAEFLLITERDHPPGALAEVASAGLPWYLNVVRRGDAEEPTPTGQLWWPRDPPR